MKSISILILFKKVSTKGYPLALAALKGGGLRGSFVILFQ
jgi:hypothetical protein